MSPFRSPKQKKYMFAKKPALAKKWAKKYWGKVKSKKFTGITSK